MKQYYTYFKKESNGMKQIKLRSIFGPNVGKCSKMKVNISFIRDFSGNLDYVYENEYNSNIINSTLHCVYIRDSIYY